MSVASIVDSQLTKLSLNGSDVLASGLAIGQGAGLVAQDISSVAIGLSAGQASQGLAITTFPNPAGDAVAIGNSAGQTAQRWQSIAIGSRAGQSGQGGATLGGAIAIGVNAGQLSQGDRSIAIGTNACITNQGAYAVAIGASCGVSVSQHENTIMINSGSAGLDTNGTGRCFIQPIRGVALGIGAGRMFYDVGTKEVQYSTT